jgi:surface protein
MFSSTENFIGVGLNEWNVSSVTDMGYMFADSILFNTNLSKWDTANVKLMPYMFSNTISNEGLGIEEWDISNVIDMSHMFDGATNLQPTLNLSTWDISNVQYINSMFANTTTYEGYGLIDWNYNTLNLSNLLFQSLGRLLSQQTYDRHTEHLTHSTLIN